MSGPRDRDAQGRPRNARPRDETGRPLPREANGVDEVDDIAAVNADDVLTNAQGALDESRPFTAHEHLETAWHSASADERDLWQGLAQFAVALTHLQRGNEPGAVALFERSNERLASYAGTQPHDIDVDVVRATAAAFADAIADGQPVPEKLPRLRRSG
jgi:hypothetical protein